MKKINNRKEIFFNLLKMSVPWLICDPFTVVLAREKIC